MASFMASLSFLTFKHDALINTNGQLCFNLNEHNIELSESYINEKDQYMKDRKSKVKNIQKVKENLKELEQLFSSKRCVYLKCESQKALVLVFNSGAIVSITLAAKNTNIEKISIDNTFCGKLSSEHVTDVILEKDLMLITYTDQKLTYIQFSKQLTTPNKLLAVRKVKLASTEPVVMTIDLFGPSGRRLEKKLSLSNLRDYVLIWWRSSSGDLWPWMPVSHGAEHNNLLIYTLSKSTIEILCTAKVHGELFHACFSRWHSNRIHTLEEIKEGPKHNVNICIYEIASGRCQCTSLSKLPLNGRISAVDWNPSEDKVFLADSDKSIFIYDLNKNTTLVTSNSCILKGIKWHPEGALAVVISADGILQCFDAALTQVNIQTSTNSCSSSDVVKFNSMFCPPKQVQRIMWQSFSLRQNAPTIGDNGNSIADSIVINFEAGTFVLVNFMFGHITRNSLTPLELIVQYLKCNKVTESVSLLQCLNWSHQSELCYQCLAKISNFLLRKPLTAQSELSLELCLGSFYNSVSTLNEMIVYDYHQQVDSIARRFFHFLLRYHRFEKAFLLAIDLQCRDLFLDLHHVAKEKGEPMLAVVSFKHAEELEVSSTSNEQSGGDSTEYSSSSSSTSSESHRLAEEQDDLMPHNSKPPENAKCFVGVATPKTDSFTNYDSPKREILYEQNPPYPGNEKGNFSYRNDLLHSFPNSTIHDETNTSRTNYPLRENRLLPLVSLSKPCRNVTTRNEINWDSEIDFYSGKANHLLPYRTPQPINKPQLEEEEDIDAEGRPVKFVHFGIV